jgi:hypothetical protein
MRSAWTLAVLLAATVTACAVDPVSSAPPPSAAVAEASDAITAAPIHSASASCFHVWECDQICGTFVNGTLVRYPTNVLHLECDDGTDTVLRTDPCGEACF